MNNEEKHILVHSTNRSQQKQFITKTTKNEMFDRT